MLLPTSIHAAVVVLILGLSFAWAELLDNGPVMQVSVARFVTYTLKGVEILDVVEQL
jgi:hypothetical protein